MTTSPRFEMADTPVIEAQLLRWSESHNGRTVTLQLPADGEHPFRGLPCGPANGQRLAIAVALISDDETTTPVEPPSTAPEKPKGGRRAREAGIACNEGAFRKFLLGRFPLDLVFHDDRTINPAATVRAICGVDSRADLDHNEPSGLIWDDIHRDYILWRDNP